VLAHPASRPHRPIRATAKRLRMGSPYPGPSAERASRRAPAHPTGRAPRTGRGAAFWNELAETDTRHYVVALLDGAVVGYAGLAVFGDEAHVLTIGVTGSVQRGGIGTALLRDLLAVAGPRRVLLDVRVDNAVAQRLYERHGFVPVGRRRRYYQPSGTDAVVMARETRAHRQAT
jgi:ribosomal-protein-alanine N-acetyltransferase